ncbi:MAG TPA: hypothetical protein VI297_06245 [Gemmatimonadales bacterium]
METRVTGYSQVERLRLRIEQAEVRHGQEVRADLPGVRVVPMAGSWLTRPSKRKGEILFCNMGPIRVREVASPGDGLPLPTRVVVEGLTVPGEGTYDVLNALVQSNGDLRLVADPATRVVPAAGGKQVRAEEESDRSRAV